MNEFYTKWKNDKRYRTKIKLLLYTVFVFIVSIYALSINKNIPSNTSNFNINNLNQNNSKETPINNSNVFNVPESYTYRINITIDNNNYLYYGEKTPQEEVITKETSSGITNYRYLNNEYYVLTDNNYQKTSKDEVYDIVNYNYLNLSNINKYLSKAQKNVNQYSVYLKDVIFGNESNEYFVIIVNDNHLNIDYTKLIKEFNPDIEKYIVDIRLEPKE